MKFSSIEEIDNLYKLKIKKIKKEKNKKIKKFTKVLIKKNYYNLKDKKIIPLNHKFNFENKNNLEEKILSSLAYLFKDHPNLMLNNEIEIKEVNGNNISLNLIVNKPLIDINNYKLFKSKLKTYINYEKIIIMLFD